MYQTILIILLIGSLNWGTTALGYNFVEIIKNLLNNSLKTETYIDKIIYFLVALAGITLAINRDLWSPCIEDFKNISRPRPPILLTAIPGDRSVQLSWSASTYATSYKIKGVDQSNNPLFRDAYNLSYKVTGLTNGRSYTFHVVGKNSAGESFDLSSNRVIRTIPTANLPIISIPEPIMYLNQDSTNDRKNVTIKFYSNTAKIYIDRNYGDFKLFSDLIGTINAEPNSDGYVILAANNGLNTIQNGAGIISITGYNSSPLNRLVDVLLIDGLKNTTLSFEAPGYIY